MKIERIFEKQAVSNLAVIDRKAKKNHFLFKFDPAKMMYAGDITDVQISDLPSQRLDSDEMDEILVSHIRGGVEQTEVVAEINNIPQTYKELEEMEMDFFKFFNSPYAKGIRLLRLFNNKVSEPEDIKFDDLEEESDSEKGNNKQQEGPLFQKNDSYENSEYDEFDIDSSFKSKKNLKQVINSQKIPPVIRKLKYGANFLLIILIALSFAEYFVTYVKFNVYFYIFLNDINLFKGY